MKKLLYCLTVCFTANLSYGQENTNTTTDSTHKSQNDKRKFEIGITPGLSIGSSQLNTGIKQASINLLVGYSYGITSFELSGLTNVTKGNVQHFQAAGLNNVVTGNAKGVQCAGLVNVVKGNLKGVQAAGLTNYTRGKMDGCQQAGLVNIALDSVSGAQIAGLSNTGTQHVKGIQIGGLFNTSKNIQGAQIAGTFNAAKHVKGSQISGLINIAKSVDGFQLSTFNFADSCNGISIGFLSFIKTGYHKLELSADEVFYTNVAFRTGTDKFHNIFSVGITPEKSKDKLWTYGYGFGSRFKVKEKWWVDVDLAANHILKINVPVYGSEDSISINKHNQRINLNNKVYVGMEWQFARKISLAAGPVFNLMLTDDRNADYNVFSKLQPTYLYSQKVSSHVHMNMWAGAKIAIRFF